MKVLDTTYLIDLVKGNPATRKVLEDKEELLTTQMNMYELIRGIFLIHNSKKELQKAIAMLESIRVLSLDDSGIINSAEIFSALAQEGNMIADSDCITAGIALSKGVNKIVTRNADHFKRIKGITVETY